MKNQKEEIENLQEMVETILRNMPATRNSDITLMICLWKKYYPQFIINLDLEAQNVVSLEHLYELPREDTIKRIRAKLNAEGKYYPTEWSVAKRRGLKEDEWRVELGYPTKGDTKHPTKDDSYMDTQRSFGAPVQKTIDRF